jgi:hypothetical protein
MKKLVMLIMVLVVISQSLIGQQIDKNSVTYKGGLSLEERFKSFYFHLKMKHNGTEFSQRSKHEQSRKSRRGQKQLYVSSDRLKRK